MRRTRIDIVCAILSALEPGSMRPTPLMSKANLPHALFKKYLGDLEAAGLLKKVSGSTGVRYALSEQGLEYMREYHRFRRFSEGFGL